MKNLAALMDRIESGSADIVREQVDTALGLWSSAHDTAHKIITISESSVAFVDEKSMLWAARYRITEDQKAVITDMRPVMNIDEEAQKTDFLDEICEQVVALVAENDEEGAEALVGTIMEAKYKAIRAGKLKRINDPIVRKRNWRKRDISARWNTVKAARRTAKRTALRPMKKIRQARSMKRRDAMGLTSGAGPSKVAGYDVGNIKEAINEASDGKNGYIGFLGDKKVEIYADTLADAKQKALAHFKPSKKDKGRVSVHLAEKDGKQVTSVSEAVMEALEDINGIAVNLLTGILAQRKSILREGYILEADEKGNPQLFIPKGSKQVVAINEKYYSTGDSIDIPADKVKAKGGKDDEFIPAGHYDIKSMNPRSTTLCQRGEDGKHPSYKCSTVAIKKLRKEGAKAKVTEEEPVEEGEGTRQVLKAQPAVIVNLAILTEGKISDNDHFIKMAAAWENFRSEPVTESEIKVLKTLNKDNVATVTEQVSLSNSFLTLCTESEIYEAIAPHCEEFDPSIIKEAAKGIYAHGQTDEALAERAEFLSHFANKTLVEDITSDELPLSESLDTLFLEGDQFDFGSADDLGGDNMDDDLDDEGMDDDLDSDLDDEGDELDSFDDGQEENTIQVDINVDDLRSDMNTILDVIGDEIEDNEEFDELRAKFEDEEEEIEPEDVTRLLQVVGDYFNAVAEERDRKAESDAEGEMGDENLNDMDDMGGDDPDLDPEGVGSDDDMGGADDDLELGV